MGGGAEREAERQNVEQAPLSGPSFISAWNLKTFSETDELRIVDLIQSWHNRLPDHWITLFNDKMLSFTWNFQGFFFFF